MNQEIRVHVASNGRNRKSENLLMRFKDPDGVRVTRSTGTKNRREAERIAAKWEAELREGRYAAPSRVTWQDFTLRYTDEVLSGLAKKTGDMANTVFNAMERLCPTRRLGDVTAKRLSTFQMKLRSEGKAESTIQSYLSHLRPALQWAVDLGMLAVLPKFPKVRRAKKGSKVMKGRPVKPDEFEAMIQATPNVRPNDPGIWQWYLTGVWLSGLRLEESLALSWDAHSPLAVDLSGRHPKFRIRAEAEKGYRDRVLPMTPDFAEFILQVPEDEREGRVFKLEGLYSGQPITPKRVSRILTKIGKEAGVVVDRTETKAGNVKVKYASAHDLRRSFGTRWAAQVKPATLQLLMRHKAIETTMKYYVDLDADDLADELWAGYRGAGSRPKLGNSEDDPELTPMAAD